LNQAITLNGKKLIDVAYKIAQQDAFYNQYVVLRRGKKKYGLIILE
jgi:tyrosyl-tRNA synthetase